MTCAAGQIAPESNNVIRSFGIKPVGIAVIKSEKDQRNLLLKFLLVAVVLCGCIAAFVSFAPIFPIATLGGGWQFGMNEATSAGLIGQPLTFTFGPFASIYSGMFLPETDGLTICGGLLLALTAAGGLLALAGPGTWMSALGFALFLPLVDMDPQLVAVPLLFLLLAYRLSAPHAATPENDWRQLALPFMTPALGLLVLVKGTSAIAAFSMVFLAAAMLAWGGRGRLGTVCTVAFLAAIPSLWLISGQDLSALPAYFVNGWYIISGYPDAMSSPGPYWHILVFLLACLFLYGLQLSQLRVGVAGKILLLGIVLLLFLGFKEGFVRHGGRHPTAAAGILVLVAWSGILAGAPGRARLGLGVTIACWLAITLAWKPAAEFLRPYYRAAEGFYLRLSQPDYPRAQFLESLAKIRAAVPLPALQGTTDVYSFSQSALLAAGLDWAPRPVLQSYSAYTPELLRADADHLTGPHAPQNVIFSVQPIDGRLPMLEDGNSWPLLLSLYQPTQLMDLAPYSVDAVILRRRATPGSYHLEPLNADSYQFGERVTLPRDIQTVIWAEVDVTPSIIGRLWGVLFKSPRLFITYHFPGGAEHAFRYVYRMGETGFVISPVVNTAADFAALPQGTPNGPRPESISIQPEGLPDWLWQPRYRIRLYRLMIPSG